MTVRLPTRGAHGGLFKGRVGIFCCRIIFGVEIDERVSSVADLRNINHDPAFNGKARVPDIREIPPLATSGY